MDRVLDRLWIGATDDFRAPFSALGFTGVLDLRDSLPAQQLAVKTYRIGNRDGDPWNSEQVIAALNFVHERIQHGNVLIACAAGMSRSASMTIGYLVRIGFDTTEAYERVLRARPRIVPVPKMLASVLKALK